ncbi:hypothetical protein FE257_006055 [Aspergillus nanangensis]|uniref:Uncharacterized protein n=1 Tax=Aspergillus nanangensis TaxID=2582783 RepID=A0AAD4CRG6_ASPNN|nr:hypothetical protein FE257_006055 [Aspergillus nanangensis]
MKLILSSIVALAATLTTALPRDTPSATPKNVVYLDAKHPHAPNGTHGFLELDGALQALDLSSPDVIHEEHAIRKPLGPDSSFNVTIGGADPNGGDLDKRQEGYCSMYFGCRNQYILVKENLWSFWTVHYGDGDALNGRSGWEDHYADSTSMIRSFGGQVYASNTKKSGCHITFDLQGCYIDVPTQTFLGSYNCAGC